MNSLSQVFTEIEKRRRPKTNEPLRLFHGRGQTTPGFEQLTIDWYPPIAIVTLQESWEEDRLRQLRDGLVNLLGDRLEGIIAQDRSLKANNATLLYGSVPAHLEICEANLRYRIEPLAAQNIGFFPDMKPGRQLVRDLATGKKVLNLFAYTCSLSVAAVAGGATAVVNLDMNRNLLDRGRENHRLNGHDLRRVSFLPHNLFKTFGRLRREGPFDLVIIDPPYRQGESFRAERDWPKMLGRLPELLDGGGEIVAAVSAPELGRRFLLELFAGHLPQAELITERTAGSDFPEADPDKGLHILHYRLNTA